MTMGTITDMDISGTEVRKNVKSEVLHNWVGGLSVQRGPTHEIRQVFERSEGRCVICKREHNLNWYNHHWNIGYFQPRSQGGSDDVSNLGVTCIGCNSGKANKSPSPSLLPMHLPSFLLGFVIGAILLFWAFWFLV